MREDTVCPAGTGAGPAKGICPSGLCSGRPWLGLHHLGAAVPANGLEPGTATTPALPWAQPLCARASIAQCSPVPAQTGDPSHPPVPIARQPLYLPAPCFPDPGLLVPQEGASASAAQAQRKMKVAVLSVALLFTILLSPPADAKPIEVDSVQCGEAGIIGGPPISGQGGGGCVGGGMDVHRVKRSESPIVDLVELMRQ
ncbi:uncharacterized protein LOC114003630 [Pipra filicauda]|uniref:Uncharacterized protein LOC114003630 n=1 Tax=Pipra filicauda TaxID=649802 RepID=A0A6J2J4U5_9PASS|nr:uncharacterized protein LOC114003630 [Pipra filicauda]